MLASWCGDIGGLGGGLGPLSGGGGGGGGRTRVMGAGGSRLVEGGRGFCRSIMGNLVRTRVSQTLLLLRDIALITGLLFLSLISRLLRAISLYLRKQYRALCQAHVR